MGRASEPVPAYEEVQDLLITSSVLTYLGIQVAPQRVLVTSDGLLVIDSGRSLLLRVTDLGEDTQRIAPVESSIRVHHPVALKRAGEKLLLLDRNGLSVLDQRLHRIAGVRVFYAIHDFLPESTGHILLNTFEPRGTRASLLRVNGNMQPTAAVAMPPGDLGRSGGVRELAYLANCGETTAVAYAHRPQVDLMNVHSGTSRRLDIPFPAASELSALGAEAALSVPSPGVAWQPTFIAGVVCSRSSIFVLLDLPRLRLLEYTLDGVLKQVHSAAHSASWLRYTTLELGESSGALYTIAIHPWTGDREVIRIKIAS